MNKQERFELIQELARQLHNSPNNAWYSTPNETNQLINDLVRSIDRFKDET